MKIKMPTTLRSRLSLFNAVFLSGTILVSLILVYFVLQTWLYHQIDSSLRDMAKQVSLDITVNNSVITYQEVLPSGELEKQGQFIRIVNKRGQVQGHWGPLGDLPKIIKSIGNVPAKGMFQEVTKVNEDEPIRIYTLPVISAGKVIGIIQTGQSLEPVENMLQMLIATFLILAPFIFLITLLASRLITGRALAPIATIAATAERISEQELNRRLAIPGEDEVARLAGSLDRMLDRLEMALESYKQFTGDASHELRTPLTVIKGEISLALQKDRGAVYYKEVLEGIEDEIDRLIRMVGQLLFLARADSDKIKIHPNDIDIRDILIPLLEQMEFLAQVKHQELAWKIPSKILISSDPGALQQILLNLLDNAIKYTPEYGKINVRVERHPDLIKISVYDTGNGIPKEHLDRIFERFYRVDKGRSRELGGTGLGLAIAQKLTHLIGGSLKVTSIMGEGTTFSLEIPILHTGD